MVFNEDRYSHTSQDGEEKWLRMFLFLETLV